VGTEVTLKVVRGIADAQIEISADKEEQRRCPPPPPSLTVLIELMPLLSVVAGHLRTPPLTPSPA